MAAPQLTETMQIRMDPELRERLREAAGGGSEAEVVRQALVEHLAKRCRRCKGTGKEPA